MCWGVGRGRFGRAEGKPGWVSVGSLRKVPHFSACNPTGHGVTCPPPESQICSSATGQSFVPGAENQNFQLQDPGIQCPPSDKIPFLSKLLSGLLAVGGLVQFPASPQSKGQ